jgi:hypothetical protein
VLAVGTGRRKRSLLPVLTCRLGVASGEGGIVRTRMRIGLVIVVTLVFAAAAACASSTTRRSGSPAASPAIGHHHSIHLAVAKAAKTSPEQLRAEFEQLLGQHAFLAMRVMRSMVLPAPDFHQAATASLQQNTGALSRIVASGYGRAQADRFTQLWQRHITDLVAYANAVASHNAPAQQTARAALMADADAYGSWLAAASKGRIRASDAAASVRMHVDELMAQLDAYAARDYNRAYQIERPAYEHMFTAGATLAKGSLPPELAVGLDTAPSKLRSAFAMLLGEHLELIIDAQRATFAGSPEFNAAGAQINANTTALAQAMGVIVGPQKAAEFQSAWADHVDGLMAYTAAVTSRDEAGKVAAENRLNSFAVTLAAYFSKVVRNQLDVVPLTGAITTHDRHLIDQVEAYAAKDYARAQQMELEGYRQMLGVASTLVDAIQRTVKPGLPAGGSQTGGGGTARRP